MRLPPVAVGCFVPFAVPPSPDEARTVTPFAAAFLYANRRFSSDWKLLKASSAEPKLCEITSARWFVTTKSSAFIICGNP